MACIIGLPPEPDIGPDNIDVGEVEEFGLDPTPPGKQAAVRSMNRAPVRSVSLDQAAIAGSNSRSLSSSVREKAG